jgi:hypothetical protein
MRADLLGVVRSATRLEGLRYEAGDPADRARPWLREEVYELRTLSAGERPALQKAWNALAAVARWDAATRDLVLAVLRETVPAMESAGTRTALGPELHPPPPPRATAAHPRAYRGTRYRPPRPPQPDAVDVRPYLLERRHIDQVLALLGEGRGADPYLAWHFGVEGNASFDPAFVMYLLPLLTRCSWSEVAAFAALARTLELHRDAGLRAALVGVLLEADAPERALGWWSHVLGHAPEQRREAAQLMSASRVARVVPIDVDVAAEIAALAPVQRWSMYRGLVHGASPAYLRSGVALGAITAARIEYAPGGDREVTGLVNATVARLSEAMHEDSGPEWWGPHLWLLCGERPEVHELLARPAFERLTAPAAFELIRLANHLQWAAGNAPQPWQEVRPQLLALVDRAVGVPPPYQRKLFEDVHDACYQAMRRARDIAAVVASGIELSARVARPPFSVEPLLGPVIQRLVLCDRTIRSPVRDAPDASWRALEAACRRANDARTIGAGLERIARQVPALMVSAFATTPAPLFETADLLAAVSVEVAERILAEYRASPLAAALEAAPIEQLCALVEPIARAGGPDPVRRALRRHLRGEHALRDAQLRGHRARIIADLDLVRLAAIRQAVERFLAAQVGIARIESSAARHALAMLGSVESNRRQLRRMLAANLRGDRDWRLRHPRTRAWLARHPRIDPRIWLDGIEHRGDLAGIGPVRLAIERDPLEALKLGTYVGSCLGRGGGLVYSAAAVVLDVNKQVVYARDGRGAVIGRQLLAISEADELVCFGVYGTVKPEQLEPLFRELDHRFAAALGLPLFGASGQDYEVASILSLEWWDDTAWTEVASG